MRIVGAILLLLMTAVSAHGEVRGEPVDYTSGDTTMKGYVAYDDSVSGKRPGILVVHEFWGHNEYARKRARMLAELGYVALAVDMYGEGKGSGHPDEARKFATEIRKNMDLGRIRFLAAMEVLKGNEHTDPDRIGAIGYCFGGGIVLQMARDGVDLTGVASFHGGLATSAPAKAGAVKAKILVLNGEDDKFITSEQIEDFKKEMKSAGANFRFISYPGATHGFTNPAADENAKKYGMKIGYNADADAKSWNEMKGFFAKIFNE
jgi:dienelactone hydrolase